LRPGFDHPRWLYTFNGDILAAEAHRAAGQPQGVCMDLIELVQWPAMAVTVAAAWLVGSQHKRRREAGFWVFLLSNILWVIWGWHDGAYALIGLQICLALLNIRGVKKNDPELANKQSG
jgi:hypothetical protein